MSLVAFTEYTNAPHLQFSAPPSSLSASHQPLIFLFEHRSKKAGSAFFRIFCVHLKPLFLLIVVKPCLTLQYITSYTRGKGHEVPTLSARCLYHVIYVYWRCSIFYNQHITVIMNFPGKSLSCLFFMHILLLLCSSYAVARERVALVIGNAAYESQPLKNPVNDAKAIANVLKQLRFDVTLVTDANQEQMETALRNFGKKLRKDKEAVFYYSGHGVQYQGDNYLIPVDAISHIQVPGHLRSRAIGLNYILELMVDKGSDMNIVLLDACRSNPFKNIFLSTEKGLATLSRRADGMLISYATSPGEIALDGKGVYSPYTTRLVELMMLPDYPVEMMFNRLRTMVSFDTAKKQIPWISASPGGSFYFNPVEVTDDRNVVALNGVTNGSGMLAGKFVHIPSGEFTMGSPAGEVGHQNIETQHQVRVSEFYMSKYEVSVLEFRHFIEDSGYRTDAENGDGSYVWDGSGWSKRTGINWRYNVTGGLRPQSEENHPVVHVSWNDAVAYCKWLSQKTGKTCRLPSEAEWEYACRAGTITPFNTGDNVATSKANYNGNYPYNNNAKGVFRPGTVSVDSFAPNAWGLYNMHGNVKEWCGDWFGTDYYKECKAKGVASDPPGPDTGSARLLRGGSWDAYAVRCRSAYRDGSFSDSWYYFVGFRPVFVP